MIITISGTFFVFYLILILPMNNKDSIFTVVASYVFIIQPSV